MRYPALRIVSRSYKFLGVVIALTTVVFFVFAEIGALRGLDDLAALGMTITVDHRITAALLPVFALLGGLFVAVTAYAAGEFIKLMIDIEASARGIYRQGQPQNVRTKDMWAEP